MKLIIYYATPRLQKLADRAASTWNGALLDMVRFRPLNNIFAAQVVIIFGEVDRSKDAGRVAQCDHRSRIILAQDVKWSITGWQRFWGLGDEDAYAALLHEFGHVLGLPHSDIYSDVMHPELGSTVISADEATRYRALLSQSPPLQALKS